MNFKQHDTVYILGSHPDTRENAKWTDAADYWAFNEAATGGWAKKIDVIFQMHAAPVYRNPQNRTDPRHWAWLQENRTIPVLSQRMLPSQENRRRIRA